MSIELEVNGSVYSGFLQASVSLYLDSLAGTFSFATVSKGDTLLPIRVNDMCVVYVEEEAVLTGYIEQLSVSGSSASHQISISGRSKTSDIIDSHISVMSDITPSITLQEVINKVLEHIKYDGRCFTEADIEPFNVAEDIIAIEPAVNAFSYIESMARKRQVLLTQDGDGNVIIARGEGTKVDAQITHKVGDPEQLNNVLSYSMSYDMKDRFGSYTVFSQANVATGGDEFEAILGEDSAGGELATDTVEQTGFQIDEEVRIGRRWAVVAENPSSTQQGLDRATWEANIRRARSKVYSASVHGYQSQSGRLWALNELVKIDSDYADINARMLVNEIEFSFDLTNGRTTHLSFMDKDAYTLSLLEPTTDEVGEDAVAPADEFESIIGSG